MREIDYGYEYPIKARRCNEWDINVRLMKKDEMPDDGETYYCDVDGTIYMEGEPDFEVMATNTMQPPQSDALTDPNAEIEITCPNCQKDFDAGYIVRNEFKIALTHRDQQLTEAVKKVLCSRTGIHTCRMGSVHVTEGEKERILALLPLTPKV